MSTSLLILAQFGDPTETFTQRYFSYVVLGLVMSFGYIVYRIQKQRRTNESKPEKQTAESELRRLEQELLGADAEPDSAIEEDDGDDVLALSPEQEQERDKLRGMAGDVPPQNNRKSDLEDDN